LLVLRHAALWRISRGSFLCLLHEICRAAAWSNVEVTGLRGLSRRSG
jgi:hypothetical protein